MVIMPQSGLWIADWNKITRIITLDGKKEGAIINAVFDDRSNYCAPIRDAYSNGVKAPRP